MQRTDAIQLVKETFKQTYTLIASLAVVRKA